MSTNVSECISAHFKDLGKSEDGRLAVLAKDRFGEGWLTSYLLDPDQLEEFCHFMFDATQGVKTRLGIVTLAILAWENNRRSTLPEAEQFLWRSINEKKLVEERVAQILKDSPPAAPAASESKVSELVAPVEELRLDVSREFLKLQERLDSLSSQLQKVVETPPVPEVPLAQLNEQVSVINQNLVAEAERRKAAADARSAREAEDKARSLAKRAIEEKERAERLAKKAARKAENEAKKKAKKVRRREIADAKKKGENPYTEAETRAFVAKLEAKGKPFYTAEQRAEYKKANPPSSRAARLRAQKVLPAKVQDGRKAFVPYSAAEKAAYVKENFTDKGKRYFTKAERDKHHRGLKKRGGARVPKAPEVGPAVGE